MQSHGSPICDGDMPLLPFQSGCKGLGRILLIHINTNTSLPSCTCCDFAKGIHWLVELRSHTGEQWIQALDPLPVRTEHLGIDHLEEKRGPCLVLHLTMN